MAIHPLRSTFDTCVKTDVQSIRDNLYYDYLYSLIKDTDTCVPSLMALLLEKDLKDLTEEANPNSRSISQVQVGFKVEIRIIYSTEVQENTYTPKEKHISNGLTQTVKRERDRFLLSLKTDSEIKDAVIEEIHAEAQEFAKKQEYQEQKKTEEYQLLHKLLIEEDASSGKQLLCLGKNIPSHDEFQKLLIAKINQFPFISCAMLNHVMSGGKSPFCHLYVDDVTNSHVQAIKSSRDRVKNLESLFKQTIESLANSFRSFFDRNLLSIEEYESNCPVEIELKEMNFEVSLDDGSTMTTYSLSI
jgi:hypothetical protein